MTVLFASIGITNAEHISNPPVSIQLSAKTTQLDRTQPLEVMPYMESKVTAETELSYAVMSVAKKTFNEQMLQHRDAEIRMHAHIEEIDYSSMFWINGHTCNKIYSVVKTQLVSTYPLELVLEVYFLL